jgi:hypothetical protein
MGMIRVESVRLHTYDGVARPEGTIYEAEEQYVETLVALGMARRAPAAAAAPPPPKKATR